MKMNKRFYLALIFVLSIGLAGCEESEEPVPVEIKVEVSDQSILEGNEGITTLSYTVKLADAVEENIVVQYETEDASAFQVLDYQPNSGTVTIPAGEVEASIEFQIIADKIKEGKESFTLLLSSSMDVDFNQTSVKIFINNDDTQLPYDTEDYTTPESYQGWTLAWADEFDGPEINTEWWTHEIGNGDNGWGNNELQYYTDDAKNSRIEDGKLVIEARNDAWNGQKYTSARMITKGKKRFQFSRVDIRAKLPYGQGIWPALWMLGENIDSKGWPACGEIDIMEMVGHQPATTHATVHWGRDFSNHKYTGDPYSVNGEIFHDRFHVFSVVRYYNQMYFYVDDILMFDFSSADLQGEPNPFNEDFFFIFNIAVGGNWPGDPDESTVFPQFMEVDYIRVFEPN